MDPKVELVLFNKSKESSVVTVVDDSRFALDVSEQISHLGRVAPYTKNQATSYM